MKLKAKAARFERLRQAVAGLRSIASGQARAAAIIQFGRYLRGRIKGELARHVKTGLALNSATVAPQTRVIDVTLQSYYRYIRWSWKKGIPISVLNRGRKIVSDAYEAALRGGGQ